MNNHVSSLNSTYYQYDRAVVYSSSTMPTSESSSYYNEIQMDDGKWTRDQTQILIDTWKEHKGTLLNTAASSAEHFKVWKLISNEVNKLSPPKSLQQCKKKFRNIRYICKTAMNNNKQSGAKKHFPMFYSDFVDIISETERLRENIKGDIPNVEIIRDANADSFEYPSIEIEEYSPTHPEQQNGVIIKAEDLNNKNKSKNLLRTKNVSSFNSTDGSYHDSPRSHESELTPSYHGGESSASPSVGPDEDIITEQRQSRPDDLYLDDNRSYTTSDAPARKHKNIDVSIMGRGYPPLKRIKRTSEVMFPTINQYLAPVTHSTTSTMHSEAYPTMASISQTNDSFPASTSNYASAALTSAAKKYNVTAQPTARDPNYPNSKYFTRHNGFSTAQFTPTLSVGSRENSLRGNSFQRDNSFNNSFQDRPTDRFLDIQDRQMELFSEMLNRHEQFLLRLLDQQREAAEESQKRDREFMLKLIEMFVKNS